MITFTHLLSPNTLMCLVTYFVLSIMFFFSFNNPVSLDSAAHMYMSAEHLHPPYPQKE